MEALVIGYGSIGKRHCRLLQKLGLARDDIFVAELQQSRKISAKKEGHEIFDLNLRTKKNFDIVVVASSTSSHVNVLKLLPKINKLLYIEKPLAHDFLKVAPLARQLSKQIGPAKIIVGYMLRQHPAIQSILKRIKNNEFGKILKYRAECGMYLPNWHPWENYKEFYMSDIDGGGGALLDISHEIDLVTYLAGKSRRVFGLLGNMSSLECTSDDFTEIILHHKNDTVGSISLDLIQKNTFRKTKIVFDTAEIEMNFITKKLEIHRGINETEVETFDFDGDFLYLNQYKDALNKNDSISCSLEEGLDIMEIIHAVRMSSVSGAFVNLPIYSG